MRTHSHKPIKILQILSREKNKKMFNITPKYFRIFNNNLPASWVKHACYSCSYYSSMVNDTHIESCSTQFSTRIY